MKLVLVLAIVMSLTIDSTYGECCPGGHMCADGGWPGLGLWGCCGVGWCNFFCCNCDGGCRKAPSKSRSSHYAVGAIALSEYVSLHIV